MGMKKSSIAGMLMTMGLGMMAMSDYDDGTGRGTNTLTAKDIEDIRKAKVESIRRKKIEKLIKQGCKKFVFGSNEIYARTQKNADRKARNNGWL